MNLMNAYLSNKYPAVHYDVEITDLSIKYMDYYRPQTKFWVRQCFYTCVSFCSQRVSWLPSMQHMSHDSGVCIWGSVSEGVYIWRVCIWERGLHWGSASRGRLPWVYPQGGLHCWDGQTSGQHPTVCFHVWNMSHVTLMFPKLGLQIW